jgi:hypothetical protein
MVRTAATPRVSNHEAVESIAGSNRQSTERHLVEAGFRPQLAR